MRLHDKTDKYVVYLRVGMVITHFILSITELCIAILYFHIFGIVAGVVSLASMCCVLHRQGHKGYLEAFEVLVHESCCTKDDESRGSKQPRSGRRGGYDTDEVGGAHVQLTNMDGDGDEESKRAQRATRFEYDQEEDDLPPNMTARFTYYFAFSMMLLCLILIISHGMAGPTPDLTAGNLVTPCAEKGCATALYMPGIKKEYVPTRTEDVESFVPQEDLPPQHKLTHMNGQMNVEALSALTISFIEFQRLALLVKQEGVGATSDNRVLDAINVLDPIYNTKPKYLHTTISPFPGDTNSTITGEVIATFDNKGTHLEWNLKGLEKNATGGIHIHVGESCADITGVKGHYWKQSTDDPWGSVKWVSYENSTSVGTASLITNTNLKDNVGHAVVVHDSQGKKVGCGVLQQEAPQNSRFELSGYRFFHARYVSEWLGVPHDFVVQVLAACPPHTTGSSDKEKAGSGAKGEGGAHPCPGSTLVEDEVNGAIYFQSTNRNGMQESANQQYVDTFAKYIEHHFLS